MAGIATIGHKTSMPTLFDHYFFSLARLHKSPLTARLVPELEAIRGPLDTAWLEELGLIGAQYESVAAMEVLDNALDGVVDGVLDRFNAVRKSLYGRLGEIQHNNPQLGSGWA